MLTNAKNQSENLKTYVVYTHSIKGQSQPFYIGCGTKQRAYSKSNRSSTWLQIYKQNTIVVNLIAEFFTRDEALDYEEYMIKTYGRLDNNTGCLINQTDGGLGCKGKKYIKRVRKSKSLIYDKYTNTITTTSELNKNSIHAPNYYYRLAQGTRGKNERYIFVDMLPKNKIKQIALSTNRIELLNYL